MSTSILGAIKNSSDAAHLLSILVQNCKLRGNAFGYLMGKYKTSRSNHIRIKK